jgi:3-hydroxybutyrate dehydrogenase
MLRNRTAIDTGSTSGIGLGIARALAAEGADLVLNGFGNLDEIEFLRAETERRYDVRVRYSGADMSKPEEVKAMACRARDELGRVDIVVNNAGIQDVAPIEDFDDARWDAILATNLSSAFHLVKAVIPK